MKMADARFEDGEDRPLHLMARAAGDVPVLAALLQDAVMTAADLAWDRRRRRFALLMNRFRWEDRAAAEASGRPYERVRCLLTAEGVLSVRSMGISRRDGAQVLSLLDAVWTPDPQAPRDTGIQDTGIQDAGIQDAGILDAGPETAGPETAGPETAGPETAGSGVLRLILAGDGAVDLRLEALDLALADVSRPYRAVSGKVPGHG